MIPRRKKEKKRSREKGAKDIKKENQERRKSCGNISLFIN
jgi:hypothetical protein